MRIDEIFIGASMLGEIFYNLFLAIMASTIFYFVVIHLKEYYDKKDVFIIIYHRAKAFVNIRNRIQTEILGKNNIVIKNQDISEDLIIELFSKINPTDISPNVIYPKAEEHTWLDFLILFSNKTLYVIKDTYQLMPYLDSKLLMYIYKIETSPYIVNIKSFDGTGIYQCPDLSAFAKPYYHYSQIVDELDVYLEEKIKLYT